MTKFVINRRQAIMLFIICTISSKLQILPCIVSTDVGKDLWQVLVLGALIDAVFLAITVLINKLAPGVTIGDMLSQTYGKFISKLLVSCFLVYFLLTAIFPFEAVRDVFASNLFDAIPWQVFSLFMIFAVGFLAFSGTRNIGRTAELYFWIIFACISLLILLGAISAKLDNILPITFNNLKNVSKSYVSHSIWFGDYMIFFVLTGRIKPNEKTLLWRDILYYAGAIAIYLVGYISFYSLYTVLAPSQTSLLSSISSFALVDLDVGRIDWFLVLLSQIASVISCATYVYCCANCIYQINGKKKYGICVAITLFVMYIADITIFRNTTYALQLLTRLTGIVALIIQTVIPLLCLISAIIYRKKTQNQGANYEKVA